jgi:hypothetical protein
MATQWTDSSLLLAIQSDLVTPTTPDANFGGNVLAVGNFRPLLCDTPKITFNTEVNELDLLTGQVGAAPEKIVGRRSGTMSFVVPLQAFKNGYDPTAEDPGEAPVSGAEVIPPWLALVGNAMGCTVGSLAGATLSDKNTNFWRGTHLSVSDYGAAAVVAAGTDSTHIEVANGALHNGGQLIAAATGGTVAPGVGFIRVKNANVMTTFDPIKAPTANYDDDNANIYGTATAWTTSDQPVALTAIFTGSDTKFAYVMTGLICESFKLTLEPGATPTVEFSFRFYDFQMDKTLGGLQVPAAYNRVPQLVGTKTGAAYLDSSIKCGLAGLAVEWKATITETMCHSAPQAISAAIVSKPRIAVNFTAPHTSDDVVYSDAGAAGNIGSHVWQSSLELGTVHSLGVYVGPSIGRSFAVLIPSARVSAAPTMADANGVQTYTVAMEAGSYTGDTSTAGGETSANCPIDSIFRLGLA